MATAYWMPQEIAAAPAALAKLDKNSDGQITSDEVRSAMPEGRGRGGPDGGRGRGEGPGGGRGEGGDNPAADVVEDTVKTLMAFDANGDGKLSRSELPERFQGLFDRADLNKDGFLTPDEIRKMAAAQAPPPEPEGRGGRGDGARRRDEFYSLRPHSGGRRYQRRWGHLRRRAQKFSRCHPKIG